MDWGLILKVTAILVIIKSLILLLVSQPVINITRNIIKTKSSLRKTALIYLIVGIVLYFVGDMLL